MPHHSVIAVSLPVGLNTGSLAPGISVRSCEVPLRRCRIRSVAQERRFLQALIPDREEPPVTPRFRRAFRLDSIGLEPRSSLQQHRFTRPLRTSPSRHAYRRHRLQVVRASHSINLQEVFITVTCSIVHRNPPARSPHREYGRHLIRGYYVFAVPVGYRYEKVEGHGRVLVRAEPLAFIVQEALEGYASGRF